MPSPSSLTRVRPEAFAKVFPFCSKLPQNPSPSEIFDLYTPGQDGSDLAVLGLNLTNPRRHCIQCFLSVRGRTPESIFGSLPAMTVPKKAAYILTVLFNSSFGLISSWVVWLPHLLFAIPCGIWMFAFYWTRCLEASPVRTESTWNRVQRTWNGGSPEVLGKPDAKYWTVSRR